MSGISLVIGDPFWVPIALVLALGTLGASFWSYRRYLGLGSGQAGLGWGCLLLRALGLLGLTFCLVDPLLIGARPTPGANLFVVLVDRSQSMGIRDKGETNPRSAAIQKLLQSDSPWRQRLGQDFEVREFVFDSSLKPVEGFVGLTFEGSSSHLHGALEGVSRRFQGRPVAGILLFSDGNATDSSQGSWDRLAPVYPVLPKTAEPPLDLSVARIKVNQTNFQAAPISLQTDIEALGCAGKVARIRVLDETGKECARQEVKIEEARSVLPLRFSLKPESYGIVFYQVECRLEEEKDKGWDAPTVEGTLANNRRWIEVDRGSGPYRVLYVGGRPNWEFKYLRRSVDEDQEIQLVGLVRVARRQPKFDFRDQAKSNNNLFKGFEHPDAETAERRDQPVMIRLGTRDASELKGGFPVKASDLFEYHALILDDLESAFFTPDQQSLIRQFVSRRGGGLLMLGGPDSFLSGKYAKTPVGELLPVYLDGTALTGGLSPSPESPEYRLQLTREGWLQPWVRTRTTESSEKERLEKMVPFHTLSGVGSAKPGAMVLATVSDSSQKVLPALVAQPFGKGRSAALLIGDLWRWGLRRDDPSVDDFDRAWRQTVRWLVADVPGRVDIQAKGKGDSVSDSLDLSVWVRDPDYQPLDDARVKITIKRPDGPPLALSLENDNSEPGKFQGRFSPKNPGIYRATAEAIGLDGSPLGTRETGWCHQPQAEELASLEPNRALLETIATQSRGEVVPADQLDGFVGKLPERGAPITEEWISPLWHRGPFFLGALALLLTEWTLRRRNGLV